MGMQLNTGDTGNAVTAEADGSLYSKIFGSDCYVLQGGNELKAEVQSNNKIKIYDGDIIMQGRHVYIPASDSDIVTIDNGSSGMNRIDLIVARYKKESNGIESVGLYVIKGTPTSGTPTAPDCVDGDILTGATAKDFPLYEVTLTGINITSVEKKFDMLGNISEQQKMIAELNSNLNNKKMKIESLIVDKTLTNTSTNYTTYNNRKISDYDLIFASIGYSTRDIRASGIISGNGFIHGDYFLFNTLHGGSNSTVTTYSVASAIIKYVNDTTISASVGGSNGLTILKVVGISLN